MIEPTDLTPEQRAKYEAQMQLGQRMAMGIGLTLELNNMCSCINCRTEVAWAALLFSFNGADLDTVELNTRVLFRRLWALRDHTRKEAAMYDACVEAGIDPNTANEKPC